MRISEISHFDKKIQFRYAEIRKRYILWMALRVWKIRQTLNIVKNCCNITIEKLIPKTSSSFDNVWDSHEFLKIALINFLDFETLKVIKGALKTCSIFN